MEKRAFKSAFLTMLSAGLLVALIPFLAQAFPVLSQWIKPYPSFDYFLKQPGAVDSLAFALDEAFIPPQSSLVNPIDSTLAVAGPIEKEAIDNFIEPSTGSYHGIAHLYPFFQALHGRKGQHRIAYYGDSSIEGDLVCMSFRDSMQGRYGGYGVGFVPIMSIHPSFRRSVHQAASNNWVRSVLGKKKVAGLTYGISGEFFTAMSSKGPVEIKPDDSTQIVLDPSYWASFKASKWFNRTQEFDRARIFYGQPNRESKAYVEMSVNGLREQFVLEPDGPVNEQVLFDSNTQRLRLNFQLPTDFPLFGVSLESKQGVIVDNFPLRGSDGGSLRYIPQRVLSEFQTALDYDLIILQFGLNVINADLKNYSWYQDKIEKLVAHFQEAMPGVPVLIIGVSDKASKINGQMQTDPSIPRITKAQRIAAQNSGAAFFSLYENMGGAGTMVDWVERKSPRLANKDYTHFNFKGAQKVSDLLIAFLDGHYMHYVVHEAPTI